MRWEYKTIEIGGASFWTGKVKTEDVDSELNTFGRDGWELVSITLNPMQRVIAVFKRSK
jgi:hypothetical protein